MSVVGRPRFTLLRKQLRRHHPSREASTAGVGTGRERGRGARTNEQFEACMNGWIKGDGTAVCGTAVLAGL